MNYTNSFQEINQSDLKLVGGKGANLGELATISGISVPDGFCINTKVYRELVAKNETVQFLITRLNTLKATDRKAITELSIKLRGEIEKSAIPEAIDQELEQQIGKFKAGTAFAIRSSATAEDLPSASFAGQQDSYLNITGTEEIRKHVLKCLASLFTERAISYRIQNGFDHEQVQLAVVVQQMVFPEASGVLFTTDPVSSNRTVSSIDATFGLGEALVSGLVNTDLYRIGPNGILEKQIASKKTARYSKESGGTEEQELPEHQQNEPVLTDSQLLELTTIGRKVEAHFGCPQDIEWCFANDQFYLVQSRPITTLFPVPEVIDQEKHVFVSVGHQQMMTDAMKPLGISIWQLSTSHPMYTAGGRLFIDISKQLASTAGRETLLNTLGKSDPLSRDALQHIMEREYISLATEVQPLLTPANNKAPNFAAAPPDPSIVKELMDTNRKAIQELNRQIQTKSGIEALDFILEDLPELKKFLFHPQSFAALMAGINASAWINEKMLEWLGEKNAADTLSQSLDHNVTSEMGLALMDVADVIRPYPEIIAYLEQTPGDSFSDELSAYTGGEEVRQAIVHYLEQYGMRCTGEIDITKTRWSEKPSILIPLILNNIRNFGAQAGKQKFEQGRKEAFEKEQELLQRLKQLPEGEQKAAETKEQIDLIRNFSGYREFPKYVMISHYFVYKQAIVKVAEELLREGVIPEKEAVFYLTFGELQEAVRTRKVDLELVEKRKADLNLFEKLSPPRMLTSDGEIISGKYQREDLPEGALAGLAVSSGIIEGRARVILNMEDAVLEEGDILVTTFTDPSWTPLFVSIKGLVTEVGGLMTHGAVIAREYGIPAVVGVEDAVKQIRDGERIRVNGREGWVERIEN